MKNIILTAMLLALFTSASFAQRGAAGIGGGRGITQVGPSAHPMGPMAPTGRPNAVGTMPPTIVRPDAVPMAPSASRTNASGGVQPNAGGARPNAVDTQRVAPPDAVGNPNAGGRVVVQH
jgi:hypothetical protein